jgi:NitT/TauT family transport system substrate-binding protein
MTRRRLPTFTLRAMRRLAAGSLLGAFATLAAGQAAAEGKIRIAQQFGIAYLILDVVRDQKLIEKHGKEAGIDIEVDWASISGATAMNEALLANNLDIVSAGVPPALTMWDRTKGDVKLVAALGSLPNYLITTNPDVKTLKDFSEKDRIAVPAAGVGFQSRTLQIEAAKLFGPENFQKLDQISISLPHPDATAALISGATEVNSHFSSAPFYYQALQGNKAVHKVISSYDILGGPATFNVLYSTEDLCGLLRSAWRGGEMDQYQQGKGCRNLHSPAGIKAFAAACSRHHQRSRERLHHRAAEHLRLRDGTS